MSERAVCVYCRNAIHLEEEIFVTVREVPGQTGRADVYAHSECHFARARGTRSETESVAAPAGGGSRARGTDSDA